MFRTSLLCTLILCAGLLSGCANTFEGAGRDIERAGQTIQDNF